MSTLLDRFAGWLRQTGISGPSTSRQACATAMLDRGECVHVHLDPRMAGVNVPEAFRKQDLLVLRVGHHLEPAIPDLRVDADGIHGTLGFKGQPHFCTVPWASVTALFGPDGSGMAWPQGVARHIAARPDTPSVPTCTFCRKTQSQVKKLIAGPRVMICDECVVLCVDILAEAEGADPSERLRNDVQRVLSLLPLTTPYATVTAMVNTWIDLSGGTPAACRKAMTLALPSRNPFADLAAVRRIPPQERTAVDNLNEAAGCLDAGDYKTALEVLDRLDGAKLAGSDHALCVCHRAWARLRLGQVPVDEVSSLDQEVVATRDDLASARPELAAWVQQEIETVRTLAALCMGALPEAEARARARVALSSDAYAHWLLARVLMARGDRDGAEAERKAGLALTHPENHTTSLLNELTAEASR